MVQRLALPALCAALAGCGAQIAAMNGVAIVNPADKAAVLANTKFEVDAYDGAGKVTGPTIFADNNIFGKTYSIRSWIKPGDPALNDTFQVYVVADFNRRAYLKQAFAAGQPLNTVVIDHQITHCANYVCAGTETVGIDFTEDQLGRYRQTGLAFEIEGRRDSITMTIPGPYIDAVITFHDAHRGQATTKS